jgi:hypothetical protein
MSKKNIKNKNTLSFKIVIIMLSFVVLGCLFYIYKMSDRTKHVIISLREEKSLILRDLEKSNFVLSEAIDDKTALNSKLVSEQQKVKKLMREINNNNLNLSQIAILKKSASNVNERINALIKELNYYKKKSDSTSVILDKQKSINDTLTNYNKSLSKKVAEASKLYYYNLDVKAYKLKSSGKKVETERSNKADILKVSFLIAENSLVKSSNNTLFIQIIDSKNKVIGKRITKNFGDKSLTYSFATTVKYKNQTIKIEEELPVADLEEGVFYVNIFDQSNVILKTTLNLL